MTGTSHACSVERRCTGHGFTCASLDRGCVERARQDGLEVACERPADEGGTLFVYCPSGQVARDSSVVWILLAVAIGIAIVGVLVFIALLRKKSPLRTDAGREGT